MKTIIKGIEQTIVLDQEGIEFSSEVKLTIIDETGNPVNDSTDQPAKDIIAEYNPDTLKFEVLTTIHNDTAAQYLRLFWFSSDVVISDNYYPEDVKLVSQSGTIDSLAEIVPVQYFIDYVLAVKSKVDPQYELAINNYIADRNGIRSFLLSAQDELEKDSEVYFTERTVIDKRDNFFDTFSSNLWQVQTTYVPINELVKFDIVYGENLIANVNIKLFTFDRIQGLIDFLPLPGGDSAGLYTLLLNNISGVAIALVRGGILDRIPNMFQVTYKTGLFFAGADPVEKEGVRKAVARRAFLDLIHIIDPAGRKASVSESIDGVSASTSYKIDKVKDELKKEEAEYIRKLKRKYGRNVHGVVV